MFIFRKCNFVSAYLKNASNYSKSYYEVLGVSKTATHAEIKSAYYELSKRYHPDTNQGSEESLANFRLITSAFEVLGNARTRKMYDKGLVVGDTGTELRKDVKDDPTTTFYKKREKRSEVPTPDSRVNYNIDAWTKAHYSKLFERKATAREEYKEYQATMNRIKSTKESEYVNFSFFLLCVSFIIWTYTKAAVDENNLSKPDNKPVDT